MAIKLPLLGLLVLLVAAPGCTPTDVRGPAAHNAPARLSTVVPALTPRLASSWTDGEEVLFFGPVGCNEGSPAGLRYRVHFTYGEGTIGGLSLDEPGNASLAAIHRKAAQRGLTAWAMIRGRYKHEDPPSDMVWPNRFFPMGLIEEGHVVLTWVTPLYSYPARGPLK